MATPSLRPAAAGGAETTFTRNLRYEIADEEGRALVGSYAIAMALGLVWILLVWFGPRVPPHVDDEAVTITLAPPVEEIVPPTVTPAPTAGEAVTQPAPGPTKAPPGRVGPQKGSPKQGRPGSRNENTSTGAIGAAFGTGSGAGTGGLSGAISSAVAGAAVASGGGGTGGGLGGSGGGGLGGKTALGLGQGGEGGRTPGRGGIGGGLGTGGGGGGGVGGVGAGGGISRVAVRVSAPRPVGGAPLGGPGRDVSELGNYVRSRESQLRFCYVEHGLKANPSLAGTINVAMSLSGSGSVTGVNITSRTWGGPGASETESCIRGKIEGWHFPSSAAGEGTYAFPFNFTK
ncbi:MAG: hypothetical protein NVS9B3_15280 [Gemmatimonadaceae bacterium]